MMKKLVILLALSVSVLQAQDAKTDFKRINDTYLALEKISMSVNYELFFDNDKMRSDKEEGLYRRDKNQYYMKQAGNEMLITEKHMVMIDNESKTIIVDRSKGRTTAMSPLPAELDSIMSFYDKIEFYKTGANNALSAYTFKLKKGPYANVTVVFDPATMLIKEIVNTYREKMPDQKNKLRTARLKTVFTPIPAGVQTGELNISNYVTSTNNKLMLTNKYKSYKLLTNLKNL